MINPLLCIFNPRNIPDVIKSLKQITKYDTLWIGRYNANKANRVAKRYFLKHDYTHIVLIPDDLLFPPWYIDRLIIDLEQNPHIEVLGCPANFDISEKGLKHYAVCLYDIPAKNKDIRQFNWLPIKHAPDSGIYEVAHQGAFCMFIARRLIEKKIVTLQQDLIAKITKDENKEYLEDVFISKPIRKRGCCTDVVISHELYEANVKQYVDFSLPIKHLKVKPKHPQGLLVGKEKPFIRVDKKQ